MASGPRWSRATCHSPIDRAEVDANRIRLRLQNLHTVQLLPAAWGTIYELTKLPDETLEQAVTEGAITSRTTRAEVRNMRVRCPTVLTRSVPRQGLRSASSPRSRPPAPKQLSSTSQQG